jgi:hypothetical protein
MIGPSDNRLYEWAEFNLPAELAERPSVLSPLARRVLAAPAVADGQEAPAAGSNRRAFRSLGSLLLPGLGFRSLPKP